jgi:hypothetical protein
MKVLLISIGILASIAGLSPAAMALTASECQAAYEAAQKDGSLKGQTRSEFGATTCAPGTAAAGAGIPVPSTLSSPTSSESAAEKIVPSGDKAAPTAAAPR